MAELGTVRLPLNVNDSDLYPGMEDGPIEHIGATEMVYCLLKYEVGAFFGHSHHAAVFQGNPGKLINGAVPIATKDMVINELERLYEEKYLRRCDPKIPLHHIKRRIQYSLIPARCLGQGSYDKKGSLRKWPEQICG